MTATATALIALLTLAAPEAAQAVEAPQAASSSYVTFNVGVELHALERAAQDTAQATEELAAAVGTMATSPSLSEEHKAQLMKVIGRVDTLSDRVVTAVDRLPAAVEEAREPLEAMASDLAARVRLTVIIVLALALLAVIVVLWAVYAFTLRPTRRMLTETLGRFQSLAEALERTAELVGESSAAQTKLAERLEAQAAPEPSEPTEASEAAEPVAVPQGP
jgi:hypothetical protein